jgi:tetratricopeptide (TPR) repeat protein
MSLALLLRDTGKALEAQNALRQTLEIWAEVAPACPNDPEFWDEPTSFWDGIARCHTELACRLQETGQLDEAEKEHRQALAIWEKLLTTWPDRYDYQQHAAWACARIGDFRAAAKRPLEGAEYHRRALRLFQKLAVDYPGEPSYRQEQARSYSSLSEILLGLGDHAEAAKIAEKLARALAKGGYQTAASVLGRCTALAEKDAKLSEADRKAVGRAYVDRARVLMQEAEEQWGDDPDFWSLRGDAALKAGQREEAIAHYTKATALKPEDPRFWSQRGAVYLNMRWWDKTVADYSKAIALKPDEWWFYHERCFAYLWLRQFDKAAADCTKGIELSPGNWDFWDRRGWAYTGLGQHDKALADYTQAIALRPPQPWPWVRRGQLYAELGQWDKAVADSAKAVELAPDEADGRYLYALVRLGAADTKGYRGICTSILERFGKTEDADAAYWVAWSCVLVPDAVAQPALLVPLAEKGVAKAPTNYDYQNALGAALYRADRFEEAVKRLNEAAAAYKPDSGFRQPIAYNWFFLAMAHHRLGHSDEAQKWLDKAVQWTDQAGQEKEKDPAIKVPMPWNRRLTLQLLRREAETLIQGAPNKK